MNFEDALKKYNGGILRGAQSRLARAIGVAPNTVSQWAGGLIPGEEVRPKIAKELGISLDRLLAMFPREKDGSSMLREISTPYIDVPILGVVPAGRPQEALEAFGGSYPVPQHVVIGDATEYFMVRAKGDSMIGLNIADGDMLAVHRQETAENGDVVVAEIDGDGVTCKRYRVKNGHPILEAANPAHKPLPERPFEVKGKVVFRMGKPW